MVYKRLETYDATYVLGEDGVTAITKVSGGYLVEMESRDITVSVMDVISAR
jgi:hypothetical protein